ncbi:MAG: N-acetyltransferase [Dehalococcoidales bacterium]|jgi:amino-acid N-acetyltransferase|nr:N-acetyltransferase [Dehalococcoidales bacterium]
MEYTIEKARINNVPQIHKLVNHFASNGKMLARSLSEIYENIRDYFVILDKDRVVACVALHISWDDLAEVKSLAVTEEHQKQGVGEKLVEACLNEATELGIPTVFCLTYVPDFFVKCGFEMVDKRELPHKIWGECYRCPKFPDCDESALIYHIKKNK